RVVVGVATDSLGRDRLERLGVPTVLLTEPTARATMQQVADVCRAQASMARGPVDESEALVGSQAAAPPDVSPAGGGTSHRSAPMT
ncbi:MAG TPA: hypothetical protein DCQ36_05055, partial [Actinobacteria bacterium]|nr:hypothetical protein [Actinomycetota bacterium]